MISNDQNFLREPGGWWEPISTVDGEPPPEAVIYDEYEFRYMGVENVEESEGRIKSGESLFTNLVSSGTFH